MIRRLALAAALSGGLAVVATGCSTGTTDPATNVTTSAATVNATLTPDGDNYRYRFEWRLASASTMNVTPWRSVSNPGTASRRVSEQISGLTANARYAFRVCGEETTGTRPAAKPDRVGYTCGAMRDFTTASPATPSTSFPDASSTGVRSGTLTPSGSLNITTSGTVIANRDISGSVVVNAPNVTIRNSRIRSTSYWLVDNNSTGLVIEDSELDGRNTQCTAIGSNNFTLRRVEITGCENGMDIGRTGNVTVEDSYIHDLTTTGDAHTDGAQIGQGAANIVFRHNNISPQDSGTPNSTSAIIMWTQGNPQNARVRLENNRLDGSHASFALYAPRHPASDIYINNNRMLKGVFGRYTDSVFVPTTVTQFNGNVDDLTGAAVRPDGVSGTP